jgi:putative ABC transport system ATP-binding protein
MMSRPDPNPSPKPPPVYQVRDLGKRYGAVRVMQAISFDLAAGATVAITGPSGSGKSTLLHCLGGVDRPDEGMVAFEGQDLLSMQNESIAALRRKKIASIFQFFYLLPTLTVEENIQFPLLLKEDPPTERRRRVKEMMAAVGIEHRAHAYPSELSGGEQQRVAIARALIVSPSVVLADEPTGNLDRRNGEIVLELMQRLIHQHATALILVTHSQEAASICQQQWVMEDGRLSGNSSSRAGR